MTIDDVCAELMVSRQVAAALPLPWIRLGSSARARRRLYRADFTAWIDAQRNRAAAPADDRTSAA